MSEGRWPANVILSPAMAEVLDGQSGILKSGARSHYPGEKLNDAWREMEGRKDRASFTSESHYAADSGGASRFFLNAGYEQWELEWIYANGLRPCGE